MASPVTIQPATADTYIYDGAPTTNYGSLAYFSIKTDTGTVRHVVLSFDFSASVPAGATITLATLSLYAYTVAAGRTIGCFRLRRTDWAGSQATWNRYKTDTDWGTAGALNTDTDIDAADAADSASLSSAGWQNWTVTAQVQYALTNVAGIAHFFLRDTGAANAAGQGYRSSQYATDTTLCPKLTIEYAVPFITGINIGDVVKAIDWPGSKLNVGDVWKAIRTVKVNIGDAWKRVYSSPAVTNEDTTYILLESGTDDRIEVE